MWGFRLWGARNKYYEEYKGILKVYRKMSRFSKSQMMIHGVIKTLKEGLTPILVDPRGTTKSREHEEVMRRLGLDRHTASAYLIALRGLRALISNNTNQYRK